MKQRLELDWIGKDISCKIEPRILVDKRSFGSNKGSLENLLIKGDNLLALKSLESEFTNKISCVYIDPPYNTGSAFEQYEDGLEHSIWLSLMRDRLVILRKLMSNHGSIWISIDDNECHYLKVLCDEIFGRSNFVSNVIWQKKYTVANDAKWLSEKHDHILVYAKDKTKWRPNRMARTSEMDNRYTNPDNHPKGPWKSTPLYAKRKGSVEEQKFNYTFKNGVKWRPPKGSSPRFPKNTLKKMDENNEIWFGVDGTANPSRKTFLSELKIKGPPPSTIWLHNEVGHNHEASDEAKSIVPNNPFSTPKPERLLKRIMEVATKPGDIILDSFAGSGTTGAVAHKMNRRWIMIEMGEHCDTHIIPRLKMVLKGNDRGVVSKELNWQGGGGFRYAHLAKSLLEKD